VSIGCIFLGATLLRGPRSSPPRPTSPDAVLLSEDPPEAAVAVGAEGSGAGETLSDGDGD
jgi:hypothetical protein